jgi:ABC-type uncharacterized transport system permease subunit
VTGVTPVPGDQVLFAAAGLLYGGSAVAYVADLYGTPARAWGWGTAAAGALAETAAMAWSVFAGGRSPYGAFFTMHFFTSLLVANFLIADAFLGLRAAGALLLPVACAAVAFAAVLPAAAPAAWQGAWVSTHVTAAAASYAAFALAFAASGLYLVQERALQRRAFEGPYRRVPPLCWLDRAAQGCSACGFALLTVALGTAAAHHRWAALGTAAVWAAYGAMLWARAQGRVRGHAAARLSVWTFTGAVLNLFAVALLWNAV